MPDISFGLGNSATFPTKYHGDVTLSKAKWDQICAQPERYYYRFNGEKIPTTLVSPDYVRHHKTEATQFIYYKEFDSFKIADRIEGPMPCRYMAVVIDTATRRICTAYPTDKPKSGTKEFKPAEN